MPASPLLANSELLDLDIVSAVLLGAKLRHLRESLNLSQLEVAKQALGFEVSHAAVSRAERGLPRYLKRDVVSALASFYSFSLDEFLHAAKAGRPQTGGRANDESLGTEDFSLNQLVLSPGFGRRLYLARISSGRTLAEVTTAVGWDAVSFAILRNYEREKFAPKNLTMVRLSVVLGVPAAWLITGERAAPVMPSVAMRSLATRLNKGLTRMDVAHAAFPAEGNKGLGRMSVLETRGVMSPQHLAAVALALDVPVEWLDPAHAKALEKLAGPTKDTLDEQERRLPSSVQKLLRDIRELAGAEMLDSGKLGAVRKMLYGGVIARKAA